MNIMEACIPSGVLPRRKNLPWLSKSIRRAIQRRNNAFRRAKHSGSASLWNKFKALRNKTTSMLRNSKQSFFNRHVNSPDKKQFWKVMKTMRKNKSTIPTLHMNGTDATTDVDKSNMMNAYFSSCFNTSLPPLNNPTRVVTSDSAPESIDSLLCSEEEVLHLLETIDISKSNGADRISGRMLKATAASIAAPVTKLFNLSISTGIFPNKWKLAAVIPIPKSSDTASPSNYRPVSLLPVLSKILERHIFKLLSKHLESSQPISDSQWGFQCGKSTTTCLLETTHNWFQLLENGNEIGAVFFDFRKAFDSVPHRALLSKLESLNLNPMLLRWVQSYLAGRTQQVAPNGITSDLLPDLHGSSTGFCCWSSTISK